MKKDNNIELLEKLLEKYKLRYPLPPDVRRIIMKRKRKDLVAILKRVKRYNRFIGASLFVFFLFRNIGIPLSLYQSAVVVILSIALATASVTGGSYYVVKKYILSSGTLEQTVDETRIVTPELKKEPPSSASLAPAFIYLAPLDASTGVGDDTADRVKASFVEEITLRKGPGSVAYAPAAPAGRGVAIVLEKASNSYTLTARVVNRATGRILDIHTDTGPAAALDAMARKIARNIMDKEK